MTSRPRQPSSDELDHRFRYHPPTPERAHQHEAVRAGLTEVSHYLNRILPDCREKSLAMTKLEEALFWSNAAVARQP